ncbi:MAG TPA: twitching motility protein PilT [Microbacteriaceae bacterium]|nr:twitching motility protein PilT [Microbacteriaceae bacterium]
MPFGAYAYAVCPARHDISLYDAGYMALAQKTRFPLITLDRKLAAIARRHCEVVTPDV